MLKLALVAVLALAAAANAGSISDSCVVADGPYYQYSITDDMLPSIGGAVASRLQDDCLWVHNDGAADDSATIYAVQPSTGEVAGSVTLTREGSPMALDNVDMTDIAAATVGDKNYLYLGDIGLTKHGISARSSIVVYRFEEPTLEEITASVDHDFPVDNPQKWTFNIPEGVDDFQTLMVDPDDETLYLVASSQSADVPAKIFSFPTADSAPEGKIGNDDLEDEGEVYYPSLVAGEISSDGRVLLKTPLQTMLFFRDAGERVVDTLNGGNVCSVQDAPELLMDSAVCFSRDLNSYYALGAKFTPAAPTTPPPPTLPMAPGSEDRDDRDVITVEPPGGPVPVTPKMQSPVFKFDFDDSGSSNPDNPDSGDNGGNGAGRTGASAGIATSLIAVMLAKLL